MAFPWIRGRDAPRRAFVSDMEATEPPAARQGGVKPPQSKALRAAQPAVRCRFSSSSQQANHPSPNTEYPSLHFTFTPLSHNRHTVRAILFPSRMKI